MNFFVFKSNCHHDETASSVQQGYTVFKYQEWHRRIAISGFETQKIHQSICFSHSFVYYAYFRTIRENMTFVCNPIFSNISHVLS